MWVFSEPTHLGTFVVPATGVVKVTLPASLSTGVHPIAVVRDGGGMLGWFHTVVHRPVSWHGSPWGGFGWLWQGLFIIWACSLRMNNTK
ncbi:MAG TPA: hypothetical protein VNT53_05940 [Pseudolysinimonas sp.]|nr:hypothetical protein [Pseudolysinimonas sp.]